MIDLEEQKMSWDELSEEQKRNCYESYIRDCIYENGDSATYWTYEEWCAESEALGEALI